MPTKSKNRKHGKPCFYIKIKRSIMNLEKAQEKAQEIANRKHTKLVKKLKECLIQNELLRWFFSIFNDYTTMILISKHEFVAYEPANRIEASSWVKGRLFDVDENNWTFAEEDDELLELKKLFGLNESNSKKIFKEIEDSDIDYFAKAGVLAAKKTGFKLFKEWELALPYYWSLHSAFFG